MAAVEPLVEVELVFRRTFDVRAYTDGFHLTAMVHGESGEFRHWPLGESSGEIQTTGDNEVVGIQVRRGSLGRVAVPAPDEESARVTARMSWPDHCLVVTEAGETTVRRRFRSMLKPRGRPT